MSLREIVLKLVNYGKLAMAALRGGAAKVHDHLAKTMAKDARNECEKNMFATALIADCIRAVMQHIYGYDEEKAKKMSAHYASVVVSMILANFDVQKVANEAQQRVVYHT